MRYRRNRETWASLRHGRAWRFTLAAGASGGRIQYHRSTLGELANVGTAAAISNAVYHATGIRVRKLPVRIEDVIEG